MTNNDCVFLNIDKLFDATNRDAKIAQMMLNDSDMLWRSANGITEWNDENLCKVKEILKKIDKQNKDLNYVFQNLLKKINALMEEYKERYLKKGIK